MRLDYPQKSNGMYILSSADLEQIGERFLTEYAPQVLQRVQPVDVENILQEALCLTTLYRYLSFDGKVLGMVVFGEARLSTLTDVFQPQDEDVQEGTVIINAGLCGYPNTGRRRFTQMHEGCHWILHRSYYSPTGQAYEFRMKKPRLVACRAETIERARHRLDTEEDFREWQADKLAVAILMPSMPFQEACKDAFRHVGLLKPYLTRGKDYGRSREAIQEVAEIFQVSCCAAQIRMLQLGLIMNPKAYASG